MTALPTVVTKAGLTPQSPIALRAQLIALVAASSPGYTANLPGSLIEDISSTDVAAVALCDSARVELVNSLTPYGANEFLLNQLGQIYGPQKGEATNTSVYVIFSGTVGFNVPRGFTVGDGTHQYVVQDGGIIAAGGSTPALYCLATTSGTWAVPANTVTNRVTSVPATITLTLTNPLAGTPGLATEETTESYRARVLQAGLAASQGMTRFLKTLLTDIPGVQPRLISTRQIIGSGWEIICGGGDPYAVADAIYKALFDINNLVGSTLAVSGITQANPGVVTTVLNHGFASGQVINIAGVVGMTVVNNVPLTITVLTDKTFSIGVNTSGYPSWTSGGVVTPNLRNVVVTINDYPDTYQVPFVNPPQQIAGISVTWNTTATNFIADSAVAQFGSPALIDYINNLPVGLPINVFEMQEIFTAAIASVIPRQLVTRLVFTVTINGTLVAPSAGTGIVSGDPESYFFTDVAHVSIVRG